MVGLAGCATPRAAAPNPFEIDVSEYGRVFDAAVLVLREQGFRVDRQDYRMGVVTTLPLDAPTLMEPWRAANTSSAPSHDSTLNAQRRLVRVSLTPMDQTLGPDAYLLSVEATLERRSWPDRRLTGSTNGHTIVAPLSDTPLELRQRGVVSESWRPMGRDAQLEDRLIAAIVRTSFGLRRPRDLP